MCKSGFKMSIESREKMRLAKLGTTGYWKGKKRPNMSELNKGKIFSEETKEKMRQAKVGKPGPWKEKSRPEIKKWMTPFEKGITPWNKGKKLPHLSGVNSPSWITDRSLVKKSEKKHEDTQYKEWMKAVKNRDGWRCKIANDTCSGRLEAHHILRWSEFPGLRYQINNGITLCAFHHPRKKEDETRLSPYFQILVGKAD